MTISAFVGHWTLNRLVAALFFVAVAFSACLMPAQNDTWWHLRAGEDIWRHGVQLRDTYSHTVNGAYWPDHEWLTQAVFYGLYYLGGMPLLTGFAAAIATAVWVIVWHLTPGSTLRRLLLCSVAMSSASVEWSLRPHLITLLFIVVVAGLLKARRYLWLPLVFLAWANFHGGVMLGFILSLGFMAANWFDDHRLNRSFLLAFALTLATTVMTPLGLSWWTEIVISLGRIRQLDISEWRAPTATDPLLIAFWVLGATLLFLTVRERPWNRALASHRGLLWSAFALAPFALTSLRNVPAFLVLAVPAIGALLDIRYPPTASVARREHTMFNGVVLAGMTAGAVAWIAYAWSVPISRLKWHPLTQGSIAVLQSCPDNLYNRYDEGGPLIWFARNRKVFLDGRQDPYPPSLIREQVDVERSGDYEALFQKYGIRCAFVPSDSVTARRLRSDNWLTLYEGAEWAVLAHGASARTDIPDRRR